MKKRFLCAALALSVFASFFASAEGRVSLMQQDLHLAARHAGDGAAVAHGGGEGFSGPSVERLRDSPLADILLLALMAAFSDSVYLSLNFPLPIQWEKFGSVSYGYAADYGWDSAWTWGWGVGADLSVFLTRWTGFHISMDFYFPQASLAKGGSRNKACYSDSDWGLSFFTGPSLAVARTERILFAISPGVHVSAFYSDQGSYSISRAMFGLGASTELAFMFSRLFFIRAGVDITFDFIGTERVRWYGITVSRSQTGNKVLNIVPSVGVGIWI